MRRLLAALFFLAASVAAPHAQVSGVRVVSSCGNMSPYPALNTTLGSPAWLTVDANGKLCTGVAVTATVSITPYTPTPAYASAVSVSSVNTSTALPSNTGTVVVYNTGSKTAYVTLATGAATATTDSDAVSPGGCIAYGAGSFDHLGSITAGSDTTTINISGGSGQPVGCGGGGGGSSVPTGSAGTPNANVLSVQGITSMTPLSVTANAGTNLNTSALATDAHLTAFTSANHTDLGTINTTLGSPLQAGGNIGNVSNITGSIPLPSGASTLNAQTNVQSAPGTPQTTAVTIQGNASGVAVPVTGTLTASVGGFTPTPSYTNSPMSVTNSSSRVALPTGTSVIVENVGANDAYVNFGDTSVTATTAQNKVPAGSWKEFTVGSAVDIAAITASSTTTLNLSGGAGLMTGASIPSAVTANAGTNLNTSLLALESGGNLASVVTNTTRTNAGSSAANALPVQGVTGGIAVPVSGTVTANAGTGTMTISGTVTANAGTNLNTSTLATSANQATANSSLSTIAANSGTQATAANQTSVIGTKAAGTAATNALLTGSVYNSSAPTLTNGQQAALQADASGNLKVVVSSNSVGTSIADTGAFTSGSTQETPVGGVYWSTPPTALTNGQAGAAAMTSARSIHVLDDNSSSILSAAQAGTQTTGSAVAASVVQMGVNSSGNARMWTAVNPSGSIYAGQIDIASVNGTSVLASSGGTGAGSLRTTQAIDANTVAGSSPFSTTAGTAVSGINAAYEGINVAGNLRGRTGVNPSGTVYAAQDDIASVAGTTASVGAGAVGNGTLRVAVGTDTGTIAGSAPSINLNNNIAQVNGHTVVEATTAGVQKVGVVGSAGAAFDTATGAAAPANALQIGVKASGATGGYIRGEIMCDSHVFKHITSATDTLAVQGVASQTIYICGAESKFAGTATDFLENTASTNANCSSANTQITGVVTGVANANEGFYNPIWGGLSNTAGNGLCINSTGTGGVDVDIWYTQF